jgi:bifunctional non-homologous end joining protein LigD
LSPLRCTGAVGRDEGTTIKPRDGVRVWMMATSKHRPASTLRRVLDAASPHAGDPAAPAILSYLPQRRIHAAAAVSRDLTLQAGFIPPCLPMTAPGAPSGRLWLHEVKHDGLRIIARKDDARVRLYSRSGDDLTQRYPLIVEGMAQLPSCTIDGGAIACDESGIASFDLLRRRQRDDCVFLYAFDLIELAGEDRRRDGLAHRKVDLSRLLADSGPGVVANEWVDGGECDGPAVFEHACSRGLEGIVSKRKDSRYISGRSPYWLKMMNPASEAVRREVEEDRGPSR